MKTSSARGWTAALLVFVLVGCGGGGYDRDSWIDTFTDGYGISRASATCILDGVEANGLQDRFAGRSVEIDFDVERVIRDCEIPILDRFKLGIGQ